MSGAKNAGKCTDACVSGISIPPGPPPHVMKVKDRILIWW